MRRKLEKSEQACSELKQTAEKLESKVEHKKKPLLQPCLFELAIKPYWDRNEHQLHCGRRSCDQQRVRQEVAAELLAESPQPGGL